MHDHFKQSDSRDADIFEVMWIFLPWAFIVNVFLFSIVVGIEGVALRINQFDGIFELWFE